MKLRTFIAATLLLGPLLRSSAQEVMLSGTVRDAVTHAPLAGANVRVLGTSKGTIANALGVYRLLLERERVRVVYSYIGYRSDTLRMTLEQPTEYNPRLQPSAIQMPEVVVTNEDPAIAIMREVIDRKRQWAENLKSYEFEAFTRFVMRFDTAIASITESYSTGYWQQGDTLREVVRQKRHTENLPRGIRIGVGGTVANFYEDNINFSGFRFVGPTSVDAFDYYDFKLEKTRQRDEIPVYTIRVIPKSRITPLFRGTLDVIGDTYALIAIDLSPNQAFTIPLVSKIDLRYKQQFGFYENRYWMPMDVGLQGEIVISVPGFTFPSIKLDQASLIYDFKINRQVADSVFKKPRLTELPTAVKFDSAFWAQHDVLPMTQEEQKAYEVLDSTQTMDKRFKVTGPIGDLPTSPLRFLEYARIRYNRVEGLFLGGKYSQDSLLGGLSVAGTAGYGFSDRRWKYGLGLGFSLGARRMVRFDLEGYRGFSFVPDEGYYDPLIIAFGALLNKTDYRDYYYAEGWRVSFEVRPRTQWMARIEYQNEDERTALNHADFSVFDRSKPFRLNPPVVDGAMRTVKLSLRYGDEPIPFGLVTRNVAEVEVEHSNRNFLASDFEFSRAVFRGEVRIPTFAQRLLFTPSLNLKLTAGISSGTLPPQRLFSLESRYDGLGPYGVLRAGSVKEFSGDRFVSLTMEHNFRSTPFLWIDIPYLYERSIELILHGTFARTWNSSALVYGSTTNGWYSEAGLSVSRIYSLLRVDITYRFMQPRGLALTIGIAQIL